MKLITCISILFLTNCASYNPEKGVCTDGLSNLLTGHTSAYFYCNEQKEKIILQKKYEDRMKNDPVFAENEKKRIKDIEDFEEKKRNEEKEFQLAKEKSQFPGSKIEDFIKYNGSPTTQEFSNNQLILWYDSYEPKFYIFTNNRLTSIIIDRNTIERRLIESKINQQKNEILEQQRITEARQNEQRRRAAIGQAMQNLGQSFQQKRTDCNPNGFGGFTCTGN